MCLFKQWQKSSLEKLDVVVSQMPGYADQGKVEGSIRDSSRRTAKDNFPKRTGCGDVKEIQDVAKLQQLGRRAEKNTLAYKPIKMQTFSQNHNVLCKSFQTVNHNESNKHTPLGANHIHVQWPPRWRNKKMMHSEWTIYPMWIEDIWHNVIKNVDLPLYYNENYKKWKKHTTPYDRD